MPKSKVLLCEDEYIVALDLQLLIEEFGFEVIGPFASVSNAMREIGDTRPDMAVLDVSLKDGEVYPLADRLQEMGVGLVFPSGHVNDHEIKARYPQAECCLKPVHTSRLKAALQQAAPLADC